jgi:hypothetical protein
MNNPNCPLENQVAEALTKAGVRFVRDSEESKNLDFYLPDFNIYLEIKGGFTKRIANQCKRDANVIVVQGVKSTEFICRLIKTLKNNKD